MADVAQLVSEGAARLQALLNEITEHEQVATDLEAQAREHRKAREAKKKEAQALRTALESQQVVQHVATARDEVAKARADADEVLRRLIEKEAALDAKAKQLDEALSKLPKPE